MDPFASRLQMQTPNKGFGRSGGFQQHQAGKGSLHQNNGIVAKSIFAPPTQSFGSQQRGFQQQGLSQQQQQQGVFQQQQMARGFQSGFQSQKSGFTGGSPFQNANSSHSVGMETGASMDDGSSASTSGGSAAKPCTNYQNTGNCRFGANCRFSHSVNGASPSGGRSVSTGTGTVTGGTNVKPCTNFQSTGTCKFGANCRFSHGPVSQSEGMKIGVAGFGGATPAKSIFAPNPISSTTSPFDSYGTNAAMGMGAGMPSSGFGGQQQSPSAFVGGSGVGGGFTGTSGGIAFAQNGIVSAGTGIGIGMQQAFPPNGVVGGGFLGGQPPPPQQQQMQVQMQAAPTGFASSSGSPFGGGSQAQVFGQHQAGGMGASMLPSASTGVGFASGGGSPFGQGQTQVPGQIKSQGQQSHTLLALEGKNAKVDIALDGSGEGDAESAVSADTTSDYGADGPNDGSTAAIVVSSDTIERYRISDAAVYAILTYPLPIASENENESPSAAEMQYSKEYLSAGIFPIMV